MSNKHKKQFGVWMDSHTATIVGKDTDSETFMILEHVKNISTDHNSNDKTSLNKETGLTHKFFKEIASVMPNIDEIHITGTGQAQEQFIKFLAEAPQYKNAVSSDSTSNRMSDENLIEYITQYFNSQKAEITFK